MRSVQEAIKSTTIGKETPRDVVESYRRFGKSVLFNQFVNLCYTVRRHLADGAIFRSVCYEKIKSM